MIYRSKTYLRHVIFYDTVKSRLIMPITIIKNYSYIYIDTIIRKIIKNKIGR